MDGTESSEQVETANGPQADLADSGVDRDQLRHQLSLTPDQRLESLKNAVAFLDRQRPLLRSQASH